jgi:hypothetical protein
MSNELTELLGKMKMDHEKQRDRLAVWKEAGGKLKNFPEGETIDDMIAREQRAVVNLERALGHLSSKD